MTGWHYVLVREDLSPAQQVCQAGHACLMAGNRLGTLEGHHIVVLGVPDRRELLATRDLLVSQGIPHETFYEPWGNVGETAICTGCLPEKSEVLSHYHLLGA